MKPSSDAVFYGALATAALVWGGSIVAQKIALGAFSVVEVSVFRGVGALTLLIPLWWWQEDRRPRMSTYDLIILAALGIAVLGNHLLTLFGLRYISAAAAGVIIGASPAITALLSSLLIRDVPFSTVAAGCAVSFVGVALVSEIEGDASPGSRPWMGGMLILLSLVSWSLYTIGSRRIMDRISALTVNWITLLISIVFQIPLLVFDHRAIATGLSTVSIGRWMALGYLIVFATALGQQAWLYGVRGVGPSRAGVFVNLIPVSALIFSALLLGESLKIRDVIGVLFILTGVWLVGWQSARQKSLR